MKQMQDYIQPFYHGTDLKVLNLNAEQRNMLKAACRSIIKRWGGSMGLLFNREATTKMIIENSKSSINHKNFTDAYCAFHENINGDKDYEYPDDVVYLTQFKTDAIDYAEKAFAVGELGFIAYVFCKMGEIVAPDQLSEQEKCFVKFVECCDRMPVVLKFTDLDINKLRFEDGRELFPEFIERLRKGEKHCSYRYLGTLPMNKEDAIPCKDLDLSDEIDDLQQ